MASGNGETHCVRFSVSGVVDNESSQLQLRVAPNPVQNNGQLRVVISGTNENPDEVRLYDNHGKLIANMTEQVQRISDSELALNITPWDVIPGLYHIQLTVGKRMQTIQLLVD